MHIINKNAGNNVLANLQDFRTKGILYDVVLKVNDNFNSVTILFELVNRCLSLQYKLLLLLIIMFNCLE